MRSAWAAGLAWFVSSVLAASCTGGSFSEGAGPAASAGAGGEPSSQGKAGEGGEPGAAGASTAGTAQGGTQSGGQGGADVVAAAGAGGTGEPVECDLSSKVDESGDCKQWACVAGQPRSVVDLKDPPPKTGECDVASCKLSGPVHTDDNSLCAYNMKCSSGACVCRGCPNGKVANVLADTCRMPGGVVATANHTRMGFLPGGAIDGDTAVTWNSGTTSGQLTLTFSGPQPMTALVVYVTGQADAGAMGARTIILNAKVDDADGGPQIAKNGSWDYSVQSTGPIRLELGRVVRTNKIVLDFSSAVSWIAVNEALFVMCADP
jgi:hypothetical protein